MSALFGCMFSIVAYQNDESSFVALLCYTGVVYAYLSDVFIFKQGVNGLQLLFAVGILLVTATMAVYKYCETQKTR